MKLIVGSFGLHTFESNSFKKFDCIGLLDDFLTPRKQIYVGLNEPC